MRLSFLGSADSAGIPVHNCTCIVCQKYRLNNIQNLSNCAYIEIDNKIILLDAGIETISNIFDGKEIIGIFLTHFHADHSLGLLRLRHSATKIKCFHPKDKEGFSDLYKHNHSLIFKELMSLEPIEIEEITLTPIPLKHSKNTFGYLIETKNTTVAYLTDCFGISKESMDFLRNKKIDFGFIDACYDERKTEGNHLNYLQASDILDEIKVRNGFLMHISHTTLEYIEKNNIQTKYPYVSVNYRVHI